MGNLLSVRRGLEHCGAMVTVTADPNTILSSSHVVLPGVGAFGNAMMELHRLRLDEVVRKVAGRGIPLMGICLGMQLLLDESEEFGITKGLGLIPGRVIAIPTTTVTGHIQKIPHIGWNVLVLAQGRKNWGNTVLQDINSSDTVYFVHSFMAIPNDDDHRVADCIYGDNSISVLIARDNVIGCQFHPEKSGEVGLKVLKRFLTL